MTLYNQALSSVGVSARISDPNEASPEADACRLWYETARDQVLRAAHWPAARAAVQLATLRVRSEGDWVPGDPIPALTGGWRYAYSAPLDMLHPRQMVPVGYRFTQGVYDGHKAVYANHNNAILEYTRVEPDMSLWDIALFSAVVAALAYALATELTAKRTFIDRAKAHGNELILEAREHIANAEGDIVAALPTWIDARLNMRRIDSVPTTAAEQYVYPYGPLIGGVAAEERTPWRAYPEGNR